ncbi:hypothetical protein BDR04DRAFT_451174 [Suillus decipiens]|nr:hypothetical protein BDR04DRAFT_451174 [Suillus decipiens]
MSSSTSTPTPTSTNDTCDNFVKCGYVFALLPFAIFIFTCCIIILWFVLQCIFLCVLHAIRGAFRAIRGTFRVIRDAFRAMGAALLSRALNSVQIESMEDDGVHGGGRTLIPLVFCGTWMRPPSPIQEAASVDQSEWSSVQPLSVLASSQVACKSVPGMGMSESVVSADVSTRHFPNDAKSFSPIQNSTEAAMVAVMIQMPSPVLRKDRRDHSYNLSRPNHALSKYQIGVAQVYYVNTRC